MTSESQTTRIIVTSPLYPNWAGTLIDEPCKEGCSWVRIAPEGSTGFPLRRVLKNSDFEIVNPEAAPVVEETPAAVAAPVNVLNAPDAALFERNVKNGNTAYTLPEVEGAIRDYNDALIAYNAAAAAADALVKSYQTYLLYYDWTNAEETPAGVIALRDLLTGFEEPLQNRAGKMARGSKEAYPVKKWEAGTRKFNAQTKRLGKAMKGLSLRVEPQEATEAPATAPELTPRQMQVLKFWQVFNATYPQSNGRLSIWNTTWPLSDHDSNLSIDATDVYALCAAGYARIKADNHSGFGDDQFYITEAGINWKPEAFNVGDEVVIFPLPQGTHSNLPAYRATVYRIEREGYLYGVKTEDRPGIDYVNIIQMRRASAETSPSAEGEKAQPGPEASTPESREKAARKIVRKWIAAKFLVGEQLAGSHVQYTPANPVAFARFETPVDGFIVMFKEAESGSLIYCGEHTAPPQAEEPAELPDAPLFPAGTFVRLAYYGWGFYLSPSPTIPGWSLVQPRDTDYPAQLENSQITAIEFTPDPAAIRKLTPMERKPLARKILKAYFKNPAGDAPVFVTQPRGSTSNTYYEVLLADVIVTFRSRFTSTQLDWVDECDALPLFTKGTRVQIFGMNGGGAIYLRPSNGFLGWSLVKPDGKDHHVGLKNDYIIRAD